MRRAGVALALFVFSAAIVSAAGPRDSLVRARQLYNQSQFEAAIAAAEDARRAPEFADSADLVAARAYLERFRSSAVPDDLLRARERLRRVNPSRFTPGERLEFIVGLGEALYVDESSGAAAAIFESALASRSEMAVTARERILDWWATALDRDAQSRSDIERQAVYQRVRERMREELATNLASTTGLYWAAAAARGQGDLQGAWDAAQAGWVRAALAPDGGRTLRDDLDRLVQRALIPERARILARPPDVLSAEWEQFKAKWQEN